MFRFVYTLDESEQLDPASLRLDEFDAFEVIGSLAGESFHGVKAGLRRVSDLPLKPDPVPCVWKPSQSIDRVVSILRNYDQDKNLFLEPWEACFKVRDLWNFLEMLGLPRVKLAWPVRLGNQTNQSPAMVVPVLNLRIGLVRVEDIEPVTLDYVKRLAGIGFEGYFVVDPPSSEDRLGEARKIVEVVRDILQPRKPLKGPVGVKPGIKK